jgi:lysophospholipase L1-like esterase
MPSASQNIEVEVDGSLIVVYVNGDPLFSVLDSDHPMGGVGLLARGPVRFDDVLVTDNSSLADVVISSPVAHSVIPGGAQNVVVSAIARNVPTPLGSVEIHVDGGMCGLATEGTPGVYTATCSNVQPGDHVFEALIKDSGFEVVRDSNVSVAIGSVANGGRAYDAIGDSITVGFPDNYALDNLSLTDQRSLNFQGWPSLLADLLTSETGGVYPNTVANEGVRGDKAIDGAQDRVASIIERHPDNDATVMLMGTNDTNQGNPTTSGAGCSGAACNGTYKGYMLDIISQLQAAGRTTIYLGLLPPAFGNGSFAAPYADPLTGVRNTATNGVIAYNTLIKDELVTLPGVEQGPDFFSCFLTPTRNRFSLFIDPLHPNGLGYQMMAELWHDWIVNGPFTLPQDPCAAPIYIVEDLLPGTYKQNLLEIGDTMYNDEAYIFTSMPSEFAGGVWIMPDNADVASSAGSLVTFDAGATPVTVYIAYDPAGSPPVSTSHTFSAYTPSANLTAAGGPITQYAFVRATGVTGTVDLGGSQSGGAGAQSSYLVVIQP